MKHLIILLVMLPMMAIAQKQNIYINLKDANGKQIKGDSMVKGFENNISALTFSTTANNNSLVDFTMNITSASINLKNAMDNKEFLLSGLITITQNARDGKPTTVYTIKMEKIKVYLCSESMGSDNIMTTSVTLKPTRIGWTYYQTGTKTGIQTVSNKYGFDAEIGGAWTKF